MTRRPLLEIVRYLRQLANAGHTSVAEDAELLERYVRSRDEAAFELLVWRHGVLVLNVCRRILRRDQDIEDAFQATFLTLVRKAPSIVRHGSIASWLYKVAYRIALEAQARTQKIAAREQSGGELLAVQLSPDPAGNELRSILDEELNCLPERLRRPLVLCYLEGKTNEAAARELGCRPGTVYSRLSRGREMLRIRLLRRGLTFSTTALAAALAQHAADAAPTALLVQSTAQAAFAFAGRPVCMAVSPRVTALAEGVLRTMFVTKLKIAGLVLLLIGALTVGGMLTSAHTEPPQPEEKSDKLVAERKANRIVTERGKLIAAEQQQIVPLVSGTIQEVRVNIGDRVKKGQTLIVLDAPLLALEKEQADHALAMAEAEAEEARAKVVMAKAEVEAAKALAKGKSGERDAATDKRTRWQMEVVRLKQEVKSGTVAPEVLEESQNQLRVAGTQIKAAEASVDAARADIRLKEGKLLHAAATSKAATAAVGAARAVRDKARIQESFTHLKAAFDGVVTRRSAELGNFVQVHDSRLLTPLLIVQRIDTLRVVAKVQESDVPLTRVGVAVDVKVPLRPGIKLRSKVSRISVGLDEAGRMPFEIDVPNPKGLLQPGMSVNITLHLDN